MTPREPLRSGWHALLVGLHAGPRARLTVAGCAVAGLVVAGLVVAGLVATAAPLHAQRRTSLTLAGWPLTTTSTTGGDFENGFVLLGSTTFTVDALNNFPAFSPRATTVEVQCVPACPASGALPVTGVQWRRNDQVTWTTLTTAYVPVESRTVTYNGTNDPWSQTMHWRYVLNWTAHPPQATSQFRIRYRLTVASP